MNPSLKLFDHLKLAAFYPEKEYKNEPIRIPHFLIAFDNSADTVITYLKKDPKRFHFHDPRVRQVTPLHLAVMKEREDLIGALLAAGSDPNRVDEGGWSPYHLVALTTNMVAILKIFKGYPVNKNLKTQAGDTFEDLLIQIGRTPQKRGMSKVFIEEEEGLSPLTEENLQKVGLESYTDSILFSPETYSFLWHKSTEGGDNLTDYYHKLFATLPDKAPKVVVAPDREICQLSGKKVLGLKAGQQIPFGSAICMYGGPIIAQIQRTFDGHLDNVEHSEDYDIGFQQKMAIHPFTNGNAARFMNDGFPNVALRFIPGKGLIAIALKDIKEGEFLHFNYETVHRLKWLGSYLKNKEELLNFFKQTPLKKIISKLESNPKGPVKKKLENLQQAELSCFPLWTPSALLFLSLKKTVRATDWLNLFDAKPFFQDVKEHLKNDIVLICWTLNLLDELQKFEKWLDGLEKKQPNEAEEIRNYFIGLLDTHEIPKILYGFYLFKLAFEKMNHSVQIFINGIQAEIDKYSWKESKVLFLPRFEKDAQGLSQIMIMPQFQDLYRKYGII